MPRDPALPPDALEVSPAAVLAGSLELANERLEEMVRARTQALEEANRALEREKAERERMADELRLAHRLEAVGQLAAGVAHEINTPIQYIGDSVQFLEEAYADLLRLEPFLARAKSALRTVGDHATADALEQAADEADTEYLLAQVPKAFARTADGLAKVASIVRAMKAFAHPGSDRRELTDVNDAIQNTLEVTRNEYRYVADVEANLADLPLVSCFPAELNQVFLNIVVNAAHAVGDAVAGTTRRGKLTVRTMRDRDDVVIEIADDGPGIPAAIRERIFDPFFTTKPVGRGSGQGLTIARSIVAKHQGRLEVESEPNVGTTFRITLPIALDAIESPACPH